MSISAYPGSAALSTYLGDTGLVVPAGRDLTNQAAAGVRAYERRVQRVMLAGATASMRRYDPPTGQSGVLQIDDVVGTISIAYQTHGSDAESLAAGDDYYLDPDDAVAKGIPYTAVLFTQRRWKLPLAAPYLRSIQVTGKWGYGTSIPEDAYYGMLAASAMLLFFGRTSVDGASGSLPAWRGGGSRSIPPNARGWKSASGSGEEYDPSWWFKLRQEWGNTLESAVEDYIRWET